MRFRFIFILLLSTVMLFSFQWRNLSSASARSTSEETMKKKRKKKPKKKKKKKPSKKTTVKKTDPRKDSIAKAKQTAKQDKKLNKLLDQKEKQKTAAEKAKTKENQKYDKCDSADVVRTSKDTLILAKYIKIYHSLGGVCYIIHLQKMAKIELDSAGFYSVEIKPSNDPRAPADWQTYLYCPIGKPNGRVLLRSPEGDTVQIAYYQDERKTGISSWYKKGKGVIHQERFVNDEKVWVKDEE
jgi:hypothetical protein